MKRIFLAVFISTLFLIPSSAQKSLSSPKVKVGVDHISYFSGKRMSFSTSLDSRVIISEYKKLPWKDELVQIDLLAIFLEKDKKPIGIIEMWFKTTAERKGLRNRASKIFRHLTEKRGIAKDRVVLYIHNKASIFKTEIWILPDGVELPQCEYCETIMGKSFPRIRR